jgi:uncharacterized membrane protein (DUF485 family)
LGVIRQFNQFGIGVFMRQPVDYVEEDWNTEWKSLREDRNENSIFALIFMCVFFGFVCGMIAANWWLQ